jgi:arylsulfatase A-like enzyme
MSTQDHMQRTVLPIPDQTHVGLTTYDAKDPDTKYPPIEQLRPSVGAPNVLIVLIDDAGFGSTSAFGGQSHQWYPALYDCTTPVEPDKTPEEGYHLTEDLSNKATKWIRQQKSLTPDKPFFVYFAPGATHAPHHVPKEWIDKYKGEFDQGWDKLREEIFARQKKLGVIPPDCPLTERSPRHPGMGHHLARDEAGASPADGGVCGVP